MIKLITDNDLDGISETSVFSVSLNVSFGTAYREN